MANLVEVLRTGSPGEADLCTAQLEGIGIPVIARPADLAAEYSVLYNMGYAGTTALVVAEADAERARALLTDLHVYDTAPTATAESPEDADEANLAPASAQSQARPVVLFCILLFSVIPLLFALEARFQLWERIVALLHGQ
jgi:hypothetical protein